MRPRALLKLLLAVCILSLVVGGIALAQSGGTFALRSYTLDGGGGSSSGDTFVLHGTAGQADAGVSSGGDFTVAGGFWHPATEMTLYLPAVFR